MGNVFKQSNAEGKFEAFLEAGCQNFSDADIVLFPLLDTKSFGSAGNRARYSNPEFDELVYTSELDVEKKERAV